MVELLQWPAMAVTVAAAWLVASRSERKRNIGFWVFIASNALWIVWGLHDHAYALVVLQLCLVWSENSNQRDRGPCIREVRQSPDREQRPKSL